MGKMRNYSQFSKFVLNVLFCISVEFLLLTEAQFDGKDCPPGEDIFPCTCELSEIKRSHLVCRNLLRSDILAHVVKASRGVEIYALSIRDSTLQYLPSEEFEGTLFEYVELVNTGLLAITPTEYALQGLEERTYMLDIINCRFMNGWSWKAFEKFRSLMVVQFLDGDLRSISSDFSALSNNRLLHGINFGNNEIQILKEDIFAVFKDLSSLYLQGNQIRHVSRSMLPNPAQKLFFINLSNNKLDFLPDDFFTNMPELKQVFISGNNLMTLSRDVFGPVWGQNLWLEIEHNNIICDCRLKWMVSQPKPNYLIGECSGPSHLVGRKLTTLKELELTC
ncbi:uncharacterized protein LOC143252800 [Tachypleus tridentatus]|uniref:uncharacterized protein LOC143252800 n=1 Tax=Tachypleus tridentatus TaxID=6853 RepID=UPI003FCF66D5